eukprot:scaffold7358_cov252-Pinguiococcus_pyrenoidosus.AAC.32
MASSFGKRSRVRISGNCVNLKASTEDDPFDKVPYLCHGLSLFGPQLFLKFARLLHQALILCRDFGLEEAVEALEGVAHFFQRHRISLIGSMLHVQRQPCVDLVHIYNCRFEEANPPAKLLYALPRFLADALITPLRGMSHVALHAHAQQLSTKRPDLRLRVFPVPVPLAQFFSQILRCFRLLLALRLDGPQFPSQSTVALLARSQRYP